MILKKYKLTRKDKIKIRSSYPYTNMTSAKPGFSVDMLAGSPEEFTRPSVAQGNENTSIKYRGADLAFF